MTREPIRPRSRLRPGRVDERGRTGLDPRARPRGGIRPDDVLPPGAVYPWQRLSHGRSRSRAEFALVATAALLVAVLAFGSLGGGSGIAPVPSPTPSAPPRPSASASPSPALSPSPSALVTVPDRADRERGRQPAPVARVGRGGRLGPVRNGTRPADRPGHEHRRTRDPARRDDRRLQRHRRRWERSLGHRLGFCLGLSHRPGHLQGRRRDPGRSRAEGRPRDGDGRVGRRYHTTGRSCGSTLRRTRSSPRSSSDRWAAPVSDRLSKAFPAVESVRTGWRAGSAASGSTSPNNLRRSYGSMRPPTSIEATIPIP